MYICIYQHLYVNCYLFVFFGLHHIIQAGKNWKKTDHPQDAATWSDLTWRLWQHLMPWRSNDRGSRSSKVTGQFPQFPGWFLASLSRLSLEYDGERWDVAQVVSVSGVWVLLFWRSHCSRQRILALADRNVWQGVAASVSQCHKGRVATGQVLLYPFCSGLQGWHMKLRTKTCCLICDFLTSFQQSQLLWASSHAAQQLGEKKTGFQDITLLSSHTTNQDFF